MTPKGKTATSKAPSKIRDLERTEAALVGSDTLADVMAARKAFGGEMHAMVLARTIDEIVDKGAGHA